MPDSTWLTLVSGAVVGGAGTWAVDSLRWRRQTSYRWDETRLAAYVDYVEALGGAALLLSQASLATRAGDPRRSRERLDAFRQRRDEVFGHLARVRVVGSEDVAARALAAKDALAAWRTSNATDGAEVDDELWNEKHAAFDAARSGFIASVREELLLDRRSGRKRSQLAPRALN